MRGHSRRAIRRKGHCPGRSLNERKFFEAQKCVLLRAGAANAPPACGWSLLSRLLGDDLSIDGFRGLETRKKQQAC